MWKSQNGKPKSSFLLKIKMSKIRLKYYKSQAYQSNTTLTEHLLKEQRLIDTDHQNLEQPRGKTLFL